ncbi:hypothetical protein LCGC14_2980540 [marine sediment metagenome]|uniref:Uncharacterized protein n=1 Tax=marine sediment metagenome TaxID=412755 RepID=A0A0F8X6P9_9ZZZZ
MTNDQLDEMHEEAKKGVKVSCDDYHPHSARDGCLSGDPMAIAVCVLCEELRKVRRGLGELCKNVGVVPES